MKKNQTNKQNGTQASKSPQKMARKKIRLVRYTFFYSFLLYEMKVKFPIKNVKY